MAEKKTKVTINSAKAFLEAISDEKKRSDSLKLLKLFTATTGEKAMMWGGSIVGFGSYQYASTRNSQKGDWFLVGFSLRKRNFAIYIMPGFKKYGDLLGKLGEHKTSAGCLYINRLSDIDLRILKQLIQRAVTDMKKKST